MQPRQIRSISNIYPEMCLTSTKELFLSNKQNKHKFICMLGAELGKYNCQIYHETADAAFWIAMITIESAENIDTVFISEDTDLIVLLVSIRIYFSCLKLKKVFIACMEDQRIRIG